MRKAFGIVLIILLSIQMVGCSNNSNSTNNTMDIYTEEINSIISSIEEMNSYSDAVITTSISVWNTEVHDENFVNDFLIMKELTSVEEVGQTSSNLAFAMRLESLLGTADELHIDETLIEYGERTGLHQKVFELCETFQQNYFSLEEIKNTLQNDVDEFKNKYEDERSGSVGELLKYYYASNSYAELALEPSGSLDEYSLEKANYEADVAHLKTNLYVMLQVEEQ